MVRTIGTPRRRAETVLLALTPLAQSHLSARSQEHTHQDILLNGHTVNILSTPILIALKLPLLGGVLILSSSNASCVTTSVWRPFRLSREVHLYPRCAGKEFSSSTDGPSPPPRTRARLYEAEVGLNQEIAPEVASLLHSREGSWRKGSQSFPNFWDRVCTPSASFTCISDAFMMSSGFDELETGLMMSSGFEGDLDELETGLMLSSVFGRRRLSVLLELC